ncbi:hypothetical protein SEA_SPILLED_195 [Streptomyces phage Spilled]|nr:hypothetical protein SEA_ICHABODCRANE_185 [Streptomyces phage IchabodCrane]UVK60051.1 hypothetical protein SEA_SPILLED_195 [Streptomyces phage Spilled]UVK61005.1 hypothetical protein SEA_JIMJAM_196 [Streptomyces phage JimJam]
MCEIERWESEGGKTTKIPCIFHGREYKQHDFYYGDQCRRCGVWKDEEQD